MNEALGLSAATRDLLGRSREQDAPIDPTAPSLDYDLDGSPIEHDDPYLTDQPEDRESAPVASVESWLTVLRNEAAADPTLSSYRYAQALEEFVRALRRVARGIAHGTASRYRLDRTQWGDTLLSVVDEQTLVLIRDFVSGSLSQADPMEFKPLLRHRCRGAAYKYLNSSAGLNAASGQSGQKRRLRELAITRANMNAEGDGNPEPEKVVARTNERLSQARKNVVRQGMVCTMEDYRALTTPSYNDTFVPVEDTAAVAVEENEDLALYSTEIDRAKALTISRCAAASEPLGAAARCWLDPSMVAPNGEPPDATQVARALGIGESTARRRLASVREHFRSVLVETYGVTGMYA